LGTMENNFIFEHKKEEKRERKGGGDRRLV
jgi:hypothetical protein